MISNQKMSPIALQCGYWSALLAAVTFIVYTVCFVAILFVSPLFLWTNLADYLEYVKSNPQFFKDFAQLAMIVFGVCYMVMLFSIHEYAPAEKKFLSRVGLCFGIVFATLIVIFYFVQLSVARLNILAGQVEGLEHLIQANPLSLMLSFAMLGWTLFFGLSSLFIAPVFSGGKLEKVIRYSLVINGINCLIGGVGYVFQNVAVIFLTINLVMGGTVLAFTIALAIFFRKLKKLSTANDPRCVGCNTQV